MLNFAHSQIFREPPNCRVGRGLGDHLVQPPAQCRIKFQGKNQLGEGPFKSPSRRQVQDEKKIQDLQQAWGNLISPNKHGQ